MSGCGGWPRASARGTTRQYYFTSTPKVLSSVPSRGLELLFWIRIIFSSAAPSLVLASSFFKKLPASNVFTATFSKYIQLLHFLIDQYPQPSDRDVRGGEDCVWNGGSCGVRDGDAHSRVRDSGASNVSFLSAAPSWVLVSYCKNWSASHVFTATYLKYIQLLHVLIGQSFQSLDRDAWALSPPPFV